MKQISRGKKQHKGFTLIETLLALSVLLLSLSLLVPMLSIWLHIQQNSYESEDRIALQQLRILLAQSEEVKIQGNQLTFFYQNKHQLLHYDCHRLVRSSGYEIFLQDLDAALFRQEGKRIYLLWTRQKQKRKALLYVEG